MNKDIIILGGGTAGWLTALFIKKTFPNHNIKLIESKKVGILGAGEGTTPQIIDFLRELEIDINELLIKTNGTIKQGISFENWNGDNKKYFHGFAELNEMNPFYIENVFGFDCALQYFHNLISDNLDPNTHLYSANLSYDNKVDTSNIRIALHFDANKLADYLKDIAISRGIKHLIGDFVDVKTNSLNEITDIVLKDNSIQSCDFVFDCSGFNRLLIGKHFKSKWKDYQKHLPMKKAIPFFLEQDEEIKPYTQAIAMKYGWVWKIPLQHRYGSGYIFDSDYINEDEALQEAETLFKQKLNSPRVINFDAGCFEKVWINNCISIGLSSGFTEPLEATSIWLQIEQLKLLKHFLLNIFDNRKQKLIDTYNEVAFNNNEEILKFLYFHYLTQRKDSKFWKEFQKKNIPPVGFEDELEKLKENSYCIFDGNKKRSAGFEYINYLQVGYGLKYFKKFNNKFDIKPKNEEYLNRIKDNKRIKPSHNNFLKNL